MIWGCVSAEGTGTLRFIDGTMDSQNYIETVQENMLPSEEKLPGGYLVFQQDTTPCHTFAATKEWFEEKGITMLNWLSIQSNIFGTTLAFALLPTS
ncbi:hypothetical protein PR048_026122 [Dryococelus australis]|uniref:Transposase n=1 Tax=Dryococelus australis TaxID=614101 RepID=A0ABQ9GKG7_9NEOP|nr:hypothetical protein PR048_026122 [Dryococelus australis]